MQPKEISYRGYRFQRAIIGHGVWLYYRFALSFRDVEELLEKRGVTVTYETVGIPAQAMEAPGIPGRFNLIGPEITGFLGAR